MKARHERELEFRAALQKMYPQMPPENVLAAAQRFARAANFTTDAHALYCAAAAHARHTFTDYDQRVNSKSTSVEKQAARAAVRSGERAKLREWGGPDRDPG